MRETVTARNRSEPHESKCHWRISGARWPRGWALSRCAAVARPLEALELTAGAINYVHGVTVLIKQLNRVPVRVRVGINNRALSAGAEDWLV